MGDSINVETGELRKFAEDVKFDASEMMQPDMQRATQPLDGVRFGEQNASGAVHAAKARYTDSLRASMANLDQYVSAAKFMAALAEIVATDFANADMRSADSTARIQQMLRTAIAESGVTFEPQPRPEVLP
jgi:hypothetical protein